MRLREVGDGDLVDVRFDVPEGGPDGRHVAFVQGGGVQNDAGRTPPPVN
ncbi:hypothetical protein [Streptomyces hokutonensis]